MLLTFIKSITIGYGGFGERETILSCLEIIYQRGLWCILILVLNKIKVYEFTVVYIAEMSCHYVISEEELSFCMIETFTFLVIESEFID